MKTGNEKLDKFLEENGDAIDSLKDFIEDQKQPLATKRDELLNKVSKLKEVVNKLDALGGLDEIEKKINDVETKKMDSAKKKGDMDEIVNQYETRIKQYDDKIKKMETDTVDSNVNSLINKAISKAKGVPELLLPILRNRVKGEYVDGQVQLKVLNDSGESYIKDGNPVTLDGLVEEIRKNDTYSRAFDGSGISGSGSTNFNSGGNTAGAPKDNPFERNEKGDIKNLAEAMRVYRENPALGKDLAEKANFKLDT